MPITSPTSCTHSPHAQLPHQAKKARRSASTAGTLVLLGTAGAKAPFLQDELQHTVVSPEAGCAQTFSVPGHRAPCLLTGI